MRLWITFKSSGLADLLGHHAGREMGGLFLPGGW